MKAFFGITSELLAFKLVGQQERTVEPLLAADFSRVSFYIFGSSTIQLKGDTVGKKKKKKVNNRDKAAARHQLPRRSSKISVSSLIL